MIKPCNMLSTMFGGIARIKPMETVDTPYNQHGSNGNHLKRCLGIPDLTMLGIGGMVGSGVYVVIGIGARDQAGPGVVLSFLFGGIITLLVAACFTEFATQVQKTGSTYQYVYVTIGELSAFMMGYYRVLTTVAAGATNGRAWSAYLDHLTDNAISNYTHHHLPALNTGHNHILLSEYPDVVAGGIIMVMVFISCVGVQCSSRFNMMFTLVNLLVLVFVSVVGLIYGDWDNLMLTSTDVLDSSASVLNMTSASVPSASALNSSSNFTAVFNIKTNNQGIMAGLLPYGWQGVIQGTGTCFWAFIGWDVIVLSAEETKRPAKTIPVSITVCVIGVTLLYMMVATALTLLTPYSSIDAVAPIPSAFEAANLPWAKYIVAFGPLCGLTTTLLSCIFVFIRMTYAMAEDGLLFKFFSSVNRCSNVPVMSCLFGGVLMSTIAVFLDIKSIITFTVLITLFQFLIVDACVIILRYKKDHTSSGLFHQVEDESAFFESEDCDPYYNLKKENQKQSKKAFKNSTPMGSCNEDSFASSISEDTNIVFQMEDFNYKMNNVHNSYLKPGVKTLMQKVNCGLGACVPICVFLITVISFAIVYIILHHMEEVQEVITSIILHSIPPKNWSLFFLLTVLTFVILILFFIICAHKQTTKSIPIKVPLLPVTPYISILSCIILMVATCDWLSWVGFGCVTGFGMGFYFLYGAFHSKLKKNDVKYTPIM